MDKYYQSFLFESMAYMYSATYILRMLNVGWRVAMICSGVLPKLVCIFILDRFSELLSAVCVVINNLR